MHIIIIDKSFPEYTIQLANALVRHPDVHVTIVIPRNFAENMLGPDWYDMLDSRITPKVLDYGKGRHLKNLFRIAVASVRLAWYIRRAGADVLHVQESGDLATALAILPFRGLPLVSTIHDITRHPGREVFLREPLRRYIVGKSRFLFVHGESLSKMAVAVFGIEANRVSVVPHGSYRILLERHPATECRNSAKTVLFFGHMYRYKGLKYLVEAEPLISRRVPGVKIIIAGSGPDFQNFESVLMHSASFECHYGFIPIAEMVSLFRRADLVVLPYTEASQSGIVAMSFTFGKPVVVSNVGAIPEIVEHGKDGLLVPPGDVRALAQAVTSLLVDDSERTRMGEAAKLKAETLLSWDRIAEKVLDLYGRFLTR